MSSKSVVITGAGSGIGRACAVWMAQQRWRVFAGVRDADAGAALRDAAPEHIVPLVLDVTQSDQLKAAADTVRDAVGSAGLDGLVNNAAVGWSTPIELVPIEDLRAHFEVNVFGVVATTQAFAPALRDAAGRIINVSSMAGTITGPLWGAYTASKFALEAVTDSLRHELQPWGVQTCAVVPGVVRTPLWDKAERASLRAMERWSARGKALYGPAQHRRLALDRELAAHDPTDPVQVAQVVHRVLVCERLAARYRVGWATKAAAFARWLLPTSVLHGMMRRRLALPPGADS
ncbi:MAG: SDR family oxidoreductase [Deltaproteobacteria bacterium]|nr:SDR family oxidoreductase [Deltaproteobacteria bacterium]